MTLAINNITISGSVSLLSKKISTPVTYTGSVIALISGEGANAAQNNTFLDSSVNNYSITRNGTITQGTNTPFSAESGKWSIYFDGSNYITTTSTNNAFKVDTGNFTFECWVHVPAALSGGVTNDRFIFGSFANSPAFVFGLSNDSNKPFLWNGTVQITGSSGVTPNTWSHVAWVRNSSVLKIYINGVEVASQSSYTTNFSTINATQFIGRENANTTRYMNGFLSNMRFVKSAVYTAAFTPSTSPLTAIANTTFLTFQDNILKDNSTNNLAITTVGTVRPFVSAFNRFTVPEHVSSTIGGSASLNGSTDYLTGASPVVQTSGDFTIEAWIFTRLPGSRQTIFAQEVTLGETGRLLFDYRGDQGGKISLFIGGVTNTDLQSTSTIAPYSWAHVAATRTSNTLRIYINGVQDASTATSSTNIAQVGWSMGVRRSDLAGTPFYLNGYISSLRVTQRSLYSGNFSVSTAPLAAVADTSLLLNFQNSGIVDSVSKNVITTNGNARISTTQSKWGNGSIEFDGDGDWLFSPYTPAFNLINDNFTIELWFYKSSNTPTTPHLFEFYRTTFFRWNVHIGGNKLILFTENTILGANRITGNTTITNNAWHHFAMTKNGSTVTFYLNGSVDGSATVTVWPTGTLALAIGYEPVTQDADFYFNGYIQDFQITKSVVKYSGNFTPPGPAT